MVKNKVGKIVWSTVAPRYNGPRYNEDPLKRTTFESPAELQENMGKETPL